MHENGARQQTGANVVWNWLACRTPDFQKERRRMVRRYEINYAVAVKLHGMRETDCNLKGLNCSTTSRARVRTEARGALETLLPG